MITLLIACSNRENFTSFASGLEDYGTVQVVWATSCEHALAAIKETASNLAVVGETLEDMSGIDFVQKLVARNPFLNCALASTLSPEAFHEATEGLGILMQLPPAPSREDAQRLLEHAEKIIALLQ